MRQRTCRRILQLVKLTPRRDVYCQWFDGHRVVYPSRRVCAPHIALLPRAQPRSALESSDTKAVTRLAGRFRERATAPSEVGRPRRRSGSFASFQVRLDLGATAPDGAQLL